MKNEESRIVWSHFSSASHSAAVEGLVLRVTCASVGQCAPVESYAVEIEMALDSVLSGAIVHW